MSTCRLREGNAMARGFMRSSAPDVPWPKLLDKGHLHGLLETEQAESWQHLQEEPSLGIYHGRWLAIRIPGALANPSSSHGSERDQKD